MKVSIELAPAGPEPFAVLHASRITPEIQRLADMIGAQGAAFPVLDGERIVLLRPREVYLVRVEGESLSVYGERERYQSRRRLYEAAQALGEAFMQISKSVLVNLDYVDCVEPYFSGMMKLRLKNGLSDYISRRYLPAFKRHFGL